MRIAYLIAWRAGRSTGPFRKMAEQARAWQDEGHEVRLFVATDAASENDWLSLPGAHEVDACSPGALSVLLARTRLARRAQAWAPDVVYVRHGVWAPGVGSLLKRYPGVLEVNGEEVQVMRTQSSLRAGFARLTRGRVLKRARAAVYVTQELSQSPAFSPYGLPALVLGNGIDLSALDPLPAPATANPRLILLSHPGSPWHGVDKLVDLALLEPTWTFDIVGPNAADLLAEAPSNLVLHGWCQPEVYLRLMAQADVGLGALAMHRVGINEASALKVREYLGLGLPVVSGCADPDLPKGTPWVLELPNTPNNVEQGHAAIVAFVESWKGRRVARESILHLDFREKERARLTFLREFARLP